MLQFGENTKTKPFNIPNSHVFKENDLQGPPSLKFQILLLHFLHVNFK